jgi:hypothetical protein
MGVAQAISRQLQLAVRFAGANQTLINASANPFGNRFSSSANVGKGNRN